MAENVREERSAALRARDHGRLALDADAVVLA
jgi:hypothetical protein